MLCQYLRKSTGVLHRGERAVHEGQHPVQMRMWVREPRSANPTQHPEAGAFGGLAAERDRMSLTAYIVETQMDKTSTSEEVPKEEEVLHNPDEDCWWDGMTVEEVGQPIVPEIRTLVDNGQHRKHIDWIKRNARKCKEAGNDELADAWLSMITCCCAANH